MSENRYCPGIDRLRLLAAVLVVTVHTSPLADLWPWGDFLLTRVVARLAVPFFFLTTGYFTLSRYRADDSRLRHFLQKTGVLYAAAIAAYLPLNLYNGAFSQPHLLPRLLKALVFEGTFYHLWYLPASMLGMLLAWRLTEKWGYGRGLAAAGILYLFGLLGDSYYGLAVKLPVFRQLYALLFELFDHTRNGIFFAPVFLMLGGFLADSQRRLTKKQALAGFAVSFALLLAEAVLLRKNAVPRHDSMYVFLLPCTVFLFALALQLRGRRVRWLRPASLLVYLAHPMLIVAVRAAAKLLRLQALLVDNSLVHFAAVCAASLAFGGVGAALWGRLAARPRYEPKTGRAYIELDLANLAHNAAVLQAALPSGCALMAVVKADAYGHGDYAVAVQLEKQGVGAFAVATIEEGIRLRRYGIRGSILILGFTDVRRAGELKKYRLTQTLLDADYAARLNRQGVLVSVHIAVDSGMHRLGFAAEDTDGVRRVFGLRCLRIEGMFTHLCCCDSQSPEDAAFTKGQIQRFYALAARLKADGLPVPRLHLQSSCGLLNYPRAQASDADPGLSCSYVRAGIALYGVPSAPQEKTALQLPLRPVLAVKARVALIRNVPKGDFVGYGRACQLTRESRIAVLPIGYADGLPRALSGQKIGVQIGPYLVPILGRICMDQLAVDITDAEGVAVGDTAVLIDTDAASPLAAPFVAARTGSISNELLSRLGSRLPVVIKT